MHYPTELKAYRHTLKHELYRSLYWYMHYKTISTLDAVVCNSNYTKNLTIALWRTSLPDLGKYFTIYPCVDVDKFSGRTEREQKVCYVGRIDKNKGIDKVIEAFLSVKREHPGAKLEIVGGVKGSPWVEAYYPELVSKLEKIKCQDISLKRDVPTNDIITTLLTSKCMASFNPEEHFGIVPVEAMAAGTPPIVADGGGQRETVQHGETGFLVRDVDEMAHYMSRLLKDEELFSSMSAKAKGRVIEHFSKKKFISDWIHLINSLI